MRTCRWKLFPHRGFVFCSTLALLLGTGGTQAADPLPVRAERLMAPGRHAATEDGAEALRVNPANMAYIPGYELRWTGVRCPDTQLVACGHSLGNAFLLPFNVATGLRLDYIMPPDTAPVPFRNSEYAWLTWGLAFKASDAVSLGASLQHSYSNSPTLDGLWGISAGLTIRPDTHLAFAAVAHDFNGPSMARYTSREQPVLDGRYVFGVSVRPMGRRSLELGAEVKVFAGTGDVNPRATLGVDVPRLGRFRADAEVTHLPNDERRAFVGSAGLEIALGQVGFGGGAIFGNGLGQEPNLAEYGTVSIASYRSPGILRASRAVTIRIEKTPGTRSHVHLLQKLWALAENREVEAVTLILRTEPASSLPHAEELSDALRVLRAKGKKVLCSLEDNGGRSLYVCANADRTVMNPAGGLRYSGLRTQYFYLAGLLEKLGVKAEFLRIGAHKSAPEQFMNKSSSDVARADHVDFLHQVEAVFDGNVARGRNIPLQQVKTMTARGPFVAKEAKDAGFVDGFAFDDEVDKATQELVGRPIRVEKFVDEVKAPSAFAARGRVGLLYVDGDMIDGRSETLPLVGTKLVGSYTIADSVRSLREDPLVRSVVLRIESPGGSSMAADVMWRELALLAKKKPLIVSMGSAAASGGYYIASAGHTIYALPLTLTGSIGVFYGKADLSGLLDRLGVHVETYKTAPRADAESLFRGFTDDERVELQRKIGQFYDVFLDRVAEGRGMTKADVDAVGQGRVWTGEQARDRKLVDKLGGLREALEAARTAAGLPKDAPIVELPEVKESLFDKALKLAGIGAAPGSIPAKALPGQVRDVARALAPMAIYGADVPMARAEWLPMEDSALDDVSIEE